MNKMNKKIHKRVDHLTKKWQFVTICYDVVTIRYES